MSHKCIDHLWTAPNQNSQKKSKNSKSRKARPTSKWNVSFWQRNCYIVLKRKLKGDSVIKVEIQAT